MMGCLHSELIYSDIIENNKPEIFIHSLNYRYHSSKIQKMGVVLSWLNKEWTRHDVSYLYELIECPWDYQISLCDLIGLEDVGLVPI